MFLRQVFSVVDYFRRWTSSNTQLYAIIIVPAVFNYFFWHFHSERKVTSDLAHHQRSVYVPEVDFYVFSGILVDQMHTPFLAEVSATIVKRSRQIIGRGLVRHVLTRPTVLVSFYHHSQL